MSTRRKPPERQDAPPVADPQEVLELLSWAARDGSVLAMKLLLGELKGEGTEPATTTSVIDELGRRRSKGSS